MPDTYRENFTGSTKPQEYDRQYEKHSYGEILWTIERQQLFEFVRRFRQSHSRIDYLDFAAGTGRVISFLEEHVDSAVGIEISPAMIKNAESKLKRGRMLCADITVPEAPLEGRYDLITAFRFFLNADPDLRCAAMNSLAMRLKDQSSRLIFNNHGNLWSHKLAMWPFHAVRRAGRGFISEGNYMTLEQAKKLADKAGLVIEKVMGCGVLGPKARWIIPYEALLSIEARLGATAFARQFGVNQMYVARLKARSAHYGVEGQLDP